MDNDAFKKVNVRDIAEIRWAKEGRLGFRRHVSEALGREPESSDLLQRHPFDLELLRVPPHSIPYRYHAHSAQWELYYVVSGSGIVRHAGGESDVSTGDAFVFKPGQAHQLRNDSDGDLLLFVIADNPVGESCYYPDENMWIVTSPEPRYVVADPAREKEVPGTLTPPGGSEAAATT